MYVSLNWVIIGLGNAWSPVQWQAITWTNADLTSIGPSVAPFTNMV